MRRLTASLLGFAILMLSLPVQNAGAATVYWADGSGNWNNPANWNPYGVPAAGDAVYLNSTGVVNRIVTLQTGDTTNISSLSISASGGGTMTLSQTGGKNQIYDSSFSPSQPYGAPLYLGYTSGSTGSYQLSGGTLSSGYQYVGRYGTGSFTQSGGVNSVIPYSSTYSGVLNLGYYSGSSGTYSLSNGQLTTYQTNVGYYSSQTCTGIFNQSGGTHTVNYLTVGSTSKYNLTGGLLQITNGFTDYGTLDFGSGTGKISGAAGSWIDLSQTSILNASRGTMNLGSNSVLVVPAGFTPNTAFGGFTTGGLVHQAGTTLTIPLGYNISLPQEFMDNMEVQGTLTTANNAELVVNHSLTISSGTVSTPSVQIGTTGSIGQVIQTGGKNQIYDSSFSPSQP
ncbi:MAG: hypothetical protein WCJ35_13600, partial [Planctomycetota bacterium]